MLVLTREEGQTVILTTPEGIEIAVSVASIGGNSVKLAFDAPMDVQIDRKEIHDQKQKENA